MKISNRKLRFERCEPRELMAIDFVEGLPHLDHGKLLAGTFDWLINHPSWDDASQSRGVFVEEVILDVSAHLDNDFGDSWIFALDENNQVSVIPLNRPLLQAAQPIAGSIETPISKSVEAFSSIQTPVVSSLPIVESPLVRSIPASNVEVSLPVSLETLSVEPKVESKVETKSEAAHLDRDFVALERESKLPISSLLVSATRPPSKTDQVDRNPVGQIEHSEQESTFHLGIDQRIGVRQKSEMASQLFVVQSVQTSRSMEWIDSLITQSRSASKKSTPSKSLVATNSRSNDRDNPDPKIVDQLLSRIEKYRASRIIDQQPQQFDLQSRYSTLPMMSIANEIRIVQCRSNVSREQGATQPSSNFTHLSFQRMPMRSIVQSQPVSGKCFTFRDRIASEERVNQAGIEHDNMDTCKQSSKVMLSLLDSILEENAQNKPVQTLAALFASMAVAFASLVKKEHWLHFSYCFDLKNRLYRRPSKL